MTRGQPSAIGSSDEIKIMMVPREWEPPLEEKYALIEVGEVGVQCASSSLADLQCGTFRVNNNPPDIANAIEDAREWAAVNGAAVMYVAIPAIKTRDK